MTEKRDGSRDRNVWTDRISGELRVSEWASRIVFGEHYVPASELESVTRERDETARELLRLTHQMQEIHYALGALSSSLGNGIGDESTTFGELIERISTGVDFHMKVAQDRINDATKRVAELETAARAFYEQASALERNVYNEYHANESLSVHEVVQLCLRCSQTGAILEALITRDPSDA